METQESPVAATFVPEIAIMDEDMGYPRKPDPPDSHSIESTIMVEAALLFEAEMIERSEERMKKEEELKNEASHIGDPKGSDMGKEISLEGDEMQLEYVIEEANGFSGGGDLGRKKGGGRMDVRACQRFKEWMNACSLIDLGYIGTKFTWRGLYGREEIGCLNGWIEFGEARVDVLTRTNSDHHPLLVTIELQNQKGRNKPFRFEMHPEYEEFVNQKWDRGASLNQALVMLMNDLKQLFEEEVVIAQPLSLLPPQQKNCTKHKQSPPHSPLVSQGRASLGPVAVSARRLAKLVNIDHEHFSEHWVRNSQAIKIFNNHVSGDQNDVYYGTVLCTLGCQLDDLYVSHHALSFPCPQDIANYSCYTTLLVLDLLH
ncbi:hypothetical protein Ahy_B06g083303 [Arachis hypogaea]|uniref:Uncharacterized protein n=1 Tax=Arachis hypogaea TaxID=3818 RepID=A0A444YPR3_ARAHY|nr:hypothetical protein Ahy_B06g083303 [Arachis hypogaea]